MASLKKDKENYWKTFSYISILRYIHNYTTKFIYFLEEFLKTPSFLSRKSGSEFIVIFIFVTVMLLLLFTAVVFVTAAAFIDVVAIFTAIAGVTYAVVDANAVGIIDLSLHLLEMICGC